MSHITITDATTGHTAPVAVADNVLAVARHVVTVHMEEYARQVLAWYLAGIDEVLELPLYPGSDTHMIWERVP